MNVFEQAWKHESENRKRRVTFQKATQQANARDDAVSGETWYLSTSTPHRDSTHSTTFLNKIIPGETQNTGAYLQQK